MSSPKKNVAYDFYISLVDSADTGAFKAAPTIAAGDFQVSGDGAAFANLATLPVVDPAGSIGVKVSLSAAEMNFDKIMVQCIDAAGDEWDDVLIFIDATVVNVDDVVRSTTPANTLAVDANNRVDVGQLLGSATGLTNINTLYDGVEGFAPAYAGPRGPGVYLNDAAANTNTVNGDDGTWNNHVSTIGAAKTIADSLGFKRLYLVNNSSVTLIATMEDYEIIGIGEMTANAVNYGSQDVDRTVFYNLLLTGTQGGTGRCQAEGCCLSVIAGMEITALGCLLADAGSLTLRNDCAFDRWWSAVAGGGTPKLNINSVANVNAYLRHGSGGIQIDNAVATTVMSIETDGQVVVGATSTSLEVYVRGNCSITDNGTTTNLNADAAMSRTGVRSAVGLASANLDTQLADIPTVAELEARTLVASAYFDPANDDVAVVTLVTTTTTNTDMVGTDGANTVTPDAAGTATGLHATTDSAIAAVKTDTGNLITRIPAALFSGITSLAEWLGLLAGKQTGNATARTELRATGVGSGTFDETTDSPEAIRDRGDAGWTTGAGGDATEANQLEIVSILNTVGKTGDNDDTLESLSDQLDGLSALSGEGAYTGTLTVDDGGGTGLEGAVVNARRGGVLKATGTTDPNGEITDWVFGPFTYDLAVRLDGYEPETDTITVSADAWAKTISLTANFITPPPNATTTTGVTRVHDEEGSVESGVSVSVQIIAGPGTDGVGYDSAVWTETSDGNGLVQFAGIMHGGQYKIWRGDSKSNATTFTAPTTGTSFDLPEVIGRG